MFIDYLVRDFFEIMVVHELALVHELIEFMTVYEQPMFMNKVRVHEQNKFTGWTSACTHLLLFYKYWLIIMFKISRLGLAQFFTCFHFLHSTSKCVQCVHI